MQQEDHIGGGGTTAVLPGSFLIMGEILPLLTEPAVVLIRVARLIMNHLRLKGMADSDTWINEPAHVHFQQLSLTERSLDGFSIVRGSNQISNRRSFNNSCLDALDFFHSVANYELAKITGCKYHRPQRGAPSVKLDSPIGRAALRLFAARDFSRRRNYGTRRQFRRQATSRYIGSAYGAFRSCSIRSQADR